MNILIINGSPKGTNSITLQTSLYLEKHFPEHHWEVCHVGQKIHVLEQNFNSIVPSLQNADLLLFSYPVYTFLAPSQLHRFMELLKEQVENQKLDMNNKWATQITTSKHFYDITAHRFIEENCIDLGIQMLPGLSADMDDLLTDNGRNEAFQFFNFKLFEIKSKSEPTIHTVKDTSHTVAIVADIHPEDLELQKMVEQFCQQLPFSHKLINIHTFPFKGGCLGCFHCSTDGKCIYTDHFDDFLRQEIQTCHAIVYAFTIQDHSMGSRFKIYDDRQFCNGHRTVTMGAPTGYIINGNYIVEQNLQMVLEGRANVGGNYLCGIATNDESHNPIHRTMSVSELTDRLSYALTHAYQQPANFLGIGGMKIFRDLIYLMRGMMRADHQFFKSHQQYDFPQKQWRTSLKMYLVGWLMNNKKIKSHMGDQMNKGMMQPYKKAINK